MTWFVRKNRVIELEGQLNLPYEHQQLEYYLVRQKTLDYYYLDRDDEKGYLRILVRHGTLALEFDHLRIRSRNSYCFFRARKIKMRKFKKIYVDVEIAKLQKDRVILSSNVV